MPVPSLISNQKAFTSPVEQQVLYIYRVVHTVATNHGLSVGLPDPIQLSLVLLDMSHNIIDHSNPPRWPSG